jgi:aryl-alcohol dehydrogenase-like predicted oxidoreductase
MASYPHKKTTLRDYRLLSPLASVRVSPLCLGAMNFGKGWEALMGECTMETATSIFDTYVSEGGNFIDTAGKWVYALSRAGVF